MPEEEDPTPPEPDPTPEPTPEPEPKHEEKEPDWVKRLEDKIDEMCKALNEATHIEDPLDDLGGRDETPIGKPWTQRNPFRSKD